ncbi:MAG: hypothetical protein RI913_65, partial [Pseudomonadota bacterium]
SKRLSMMCQQVSDWVILTSGVWIQRKT